MCVRLVYEIEKACHDQQWVAWFWFPLWGNICMRLSRRKLKMRFPSFLFSTFAKHKNIPLDISMLLPRIETRNQDIFQDWCMWASISWLFGKILVSTHQSWPRTREMAKVCVSFRISETVAQRMQYLGAYHRTISLSAAKSFWWKSKLCTQSSSSQSFEGC